MLLTAGQVIAGDLLWERGRSTVDVDGLLWMPVSVLRQTEGCCVLSKIFCMFMQHVVCNVQC